MRLTLKSVQPETLAFNYLASLEDGMRNYYNIGLGVWVKAAGLCGYVDCTFSSMLPWWNYAVSCFKVMATLRP